MFLAFFKVNLLVSHVGLQLPLQWSYCEDPLVATLQCLFGYADGELRMAQRIDQHVFGLWEETGAPGGNPCRHDEMCRHHADSDQSQELNTDPWRSEVAGLTTVPQRHTIASGFESWSMNFLLQLCGPLC